MKAPIRGLYALTPDVAPTERLLAMVRPVLENGAALLQYRNKAADPQLQHEQASALLAICRQRNVPLIINDDPLLAARIDADGVHVGADDASLVAARQMLGHGKLIGVSCYNQLDLALSAQDQTADYVAFGRFFPSTTKPLAVAATLDLLRTARRQLHVPIVAIGGITLHNAPSLINAGASAIAVISTLYDGPDNAATALQFAALFPDGTERADTHSLNQKTQGMT